MSYELGLTDSATVSHALPTPRKIINGAKPSELPILQPTKFDFVVNMKAAKALGLAIPPSILSRADEVIE